MAAVAHDPKFAAKAGVPRSVGLEFNMADKSKHLAAAILRKKEARHVT